MALLAQASAQLTEIAAPYVQCVRPYVASCSLTERSSTTEQCNFMKCKCKQSYQTGFLLSLPTPLPLAVSHQCLHSFCLASLAELPASLLYVANVISMNKTYTIPGIVT